jgi:CubicO group peptidase (beta-lactamase class C family)
MISVVVRFGTRSALLATIALRAQTTPPPLAAEEHVLPPQKIQESLRFVPGRMTHYHVPGVSLALIHNDNIDWTQTFGVAGPSGAPVRPETLFQASSISMPVTAVAVLRLAEQGKLNLDVDVNQYLKSWKVPNNRFTAQQKVTLRELLSHTAGATVHGFQGYVAGQKIPTLIQVLNGDHPANSPPIAIDFVPGTKFRYAGGNYVIVQQILTDVTGEPFPTLMQKLVLQPLHMSHSTFEQSLQEELPLSAAMPYDDNGKPMEGGPQVFPEMAVAGLWTTPSDLALFALAIQGSLAGKSGAIVSQSTAQQLLQPVLASYGLGFFMTGSGDNRYFSHPGANPGYLSFFFAYEKGDGVVLMTNSQFS